MLLLTLFAAFIPATLAIKCYTCSYSPMDAPNRTVLCNDEHFEANAVAIADCEHGCQTLVHMDSNGAVEQLRRNCLQPDEPLTNNCVTETNKALTTKRCTCNYNLCNTATSFCASFTALLLPLAFALHKYLL